VRRQSLDGFWLGFKSSLTNQALHLKINHIQIDNPTILYPIVSKAAATDIRKSFVFFLSLSFC